MRILKVLAVLILAAVIGLAGYAYLGDMDPDRAQVRQPLDLDAAAPAPADPAPADPAPADPAPAAPNDD